MTDKLEETLYRYAPAALGEVFALPAAVADEHLKMAGPCPLKLLLWLARRGPARYDAAECSRAIGYSEADCDDALRYWLNAGLLVSAGAESSPPPAAPARPAFSSVTPAPPAAAPKAAEEPPASRPRAVKPQMAEVIRRQKESEEFAGLLDTVSARLGRPISHGDMETLLYLYDSAGLPAEVILMVVEYAVAAGKTNMRYIEKVALDWADRGIVTMEAAEAFLCAAERRRTAWEKVSAALGLSQSPTLQQSETAARWVYEWQVDDDLLRMAYQRCAAATGRFQSSYMNKVIESWRADGVDTPEKALEWQEAAKNRGKRSKTRREPSYDLNEYESMVTGFTPVYKK